MLPAPAPEASIDLAVNARRLSILPKLPSAGKSAALSPQMHFFAVTDTMLAWSRRAAHLGLIDLGRKSGIEFVPFAT